MKLPVRKYGDPVLRKKGAPVAEVTPDQIASPHDLARYYFSHEAA